MQVVYDKLFDKLKANHLTQKDFKAKANIGGGTMLKLINNDSVNTSTICRICDYFQCMPDEIMEWIPDSDYEAKRKEKAEIEKQIAELQAKLKS
jgi:putative transcriptional regulator